MKTELTSFVSFDEVVLKDEKILKQFLEEFKTSSIKPSEISREDFILRGCLTGMYSKGPKRIDFKLNCKKGEFEVRFHLFKSFTGFTLEENHQKSPFQLRVLIPKEITADVKKTIGSLIVCYCEKEADFFLNYLSQIGAAMIPA